MKIAILATTFYQSQGADRLSWQQANALAQKGDDVTIFAFDSKLEPPPGVKIEVLGMPKGFYTERIFRMSLPLNFIKAIRWLPKLKHFDIIYAHAYPASWFAYLAKKLYRVKYIHCFYHLNMPGFYPGLIPHIYTIAQLFLERWTSKRADGGITISEFARAQLKDFSGLDSKVVYPQIDCDKFHSGLDFSRIRNRYKIEDAPLILFVGGLSPQKGVHLLIEAFKVVKKNIIDANLLVVGKHLFADYSETIRQLSDNSVIFSGEMPEADIPYCYAACDAYATATRWEGFNLPLAEAQACGKPVVAFNIGPHPEVVTEGETGFLVPDGDIDAMAEAIVRVLRDDKLKRMMGKNGEKLIKDRFSMDNYASTEF